MPMCGCRWRWVMNLKEEMRLGSEKVWFGMPKQCDAARRDEDTADVLAADSQPVHIMKAFVKRECNVIVKRSLHDRNEHKNPISYSPNPNET